MPIDATGDVRSPLSLDTMASPEVLRKTLARLEEKQLPLVYMEASVESWDTVREALLVLRASNRSAIITVKKPDIALDYEECDAVFKFLQHWDQLFLVNVLNLVGDVIPETYMKLMNAEIRIELMWFREWFMASQDERISKYPGLPWRSYIRRIVNENFTFSRRLMEFKFVPPPAEETSQKEAMLAEILKDFLVSRKKAVCLFPKKWGQKNA